MSRAAKAAAQLATVGAVVLAVVNRVMGRTFTQRELFQGVLRLETTSWVLISISNAAKVITAAGLAYIFYLLRAVLRAIEEGTPFGEEACVHMRRMGYMVLLVGVLRPTVDYLAAELILKRLPTLEPAISLPSPFQAEVILASALILILAQLWSYGLELERDRALTV